MLAILLSLFTLSSQAQAADGTLIAPVSNTASSESRLSALQTRYIDEIVTVYGADLKADLRERLRDYVTAVVRTSPGADINEAVSMMPGLIEKQAEVVADQVQESLFAYRLGRSTALRDELSLTMAEVIKAHAMIAGNQACLDTMKEKTFTASALTGGSVMACGFAMLLQSSTAPLSTIMAEAGLLSTGAVMVMYGAPLLRTAFPNLYRDDVQTQQAERLRDDFWKQVDVHLYREAEWRHFARSQDQGKITAIVFRKFLSSLWPGHHEEVCEKLLADQASDAQGAL